MSAMFLNMARAKHICILLSLFVCLGESEETEIYTAVKKLSALIITVGNTLDAVIDSWREGRREVLTEDM